MSKKEVLIKIFGISIFFLVLKILLFYNSVYGQSSIKDMVLNPSIVDIADVLPPIEVLIDSAYANVASIKARECNIEYQNTQITVAKRSWLKYLSLETFYNYGTADIYTLNNIGSANTQQVNSRYTFGASLKLPLFDVINRGNAIKAEKIRYEFFCNEAESEKQAIKKVVIQQYYDVLLKHKIFKINNESYIESKMQAEMAEKQFTNGEIQIIEFSRLKSIKSSSQTLYETSKTDFTVSYILLQDLTGIKFNKLTFIE